MVLAHLMGGARVMSLMDEVCLTLPVIAPPQSGKEFPHLGYKLRQRDEFRVSSSAKSCQEDLFTQKSEASSTSIFLSPALRASSPARRPEDTSMTPLSLLLSILTVASFHGMACCSTMCNNQCCRFVEGFPVRLKKLREDFSQIRDYYEANDDLDTALLDQSVEIYFRSPFGCHAMNSILEFYLRTVFPTAMAGVTEGNRDLKPHMESIQQIFDGLKSDVVRCRNYFSCKKPFDIKDLNSTYTQMESKGLYKAMGELDLFFNYIETYLASKRHRQ